MDDRVNRDAAAASGRATTVLLWALVVTGAALRLWTLAGHPCLWMDEGMLAANLVARDFAGLLEPLEYRQAAPIGFLLVEKLALVVGGGWEPDLALRAFPFACALASLPLFLTLCRRWLSPLASIVAMALFALSPAHVHYSIQVKPYAVDVLAALLVLHLAARALADGEVDGPAARRLALVGAVVVWFSFPVAFVLAGAGAVLIVRALWASRRGEAVRVAGAAVAWLGSFAIAFWLGGVGTSDSSLLVDWWRGAFAPIPPTSLTDVLWYRDAGFGVVRFCTGVGPYAALALGILALIDGRKEPWLPCATVPALVAVVVSSAELYPFERRFALFLLPAIALILGRGAALMEKRAHIATRALATVAVAVAVWGTLGGLRAELTRPPHLDLRTPCAHVAEHGEAGDRIVTVGVDQNLSGTLRYYGWATGLSMADVEIAERVEDAEAALRQQSSGWLVLVKTPPEERDALLGRLRAGSSVRLVVDTPKTQAYRIERVR